MLWFEAVLFVILTGLAYLILKRVRPQRRVNGALWIAFYFTVPLAAYDWLYCSVHLGHGVAFLWRYWYLTTYYVIPWLLFPGMAALLNGRQKAEADNDERP
jgi:apolipoprotein N-acyltransferase